MMVNRTFAGGGRLAAKLLILLGFAWLGLGVARAQTAGGSTALPPLPAVQDEVVGGAVDPAAPTSTQAAPAPSPAAPAAPVAPQALPGASDLRSLAPTPAVSGRFKSEAEARDAMREAFATRNYTAVLELAVDARRQFPAETFMRYFEAQARIALQNGDGAPAKIPFQHMDTQPEGSPSGKPAQAAAKATPTLTPTPAPTARPTPAPRSKPAPTRVAPPPTAWAVKSHQLLNTLDDLKLVLLGGAGLVAILAVSVVLLRRGKRAEEESEEDEAGHYGALPGARQSDREFSTPEREYPLESGLAQPVFRSEVHAMAAARQQAFTPAAPPPEPIEAPAARPEFNPDEIFFHPVDQPAYELTPESRPEPEPLHELFQPGLDEKSEPCEPFAEQPAPSSSEAEESFEFSKDYESPNLEPKLTLSDFRFDEDEVENPPAEASSNEPTPAPLTSAGFAEYDPVAFAAAEPFQGIFQDVPDNKTIFGSILDEETTGRQKVEPAEKIELYAFHPDETVRIRVNPEEEIEEAVDRLGASATPATGEDNLTVDTSDSSTDVFEREYQQGLKDIEDRNWVSAIHHLSIAAALRPSAMEVKDKLREARRMRARELEGRA